VLLDTCTLLWLASTPRKLPGGVLRAITDNAGHLFISAITAFEIGIKHRPPGSAAPPG
jgi:PIN domain nuclease of toxin-antitoxin system